jgi:hypothetical protein
MIGLNENKRTLQRILVRFYPPGIILEIADEDNLVENKSIDLLNLSLRYNIFINLARM